jgi:hypothetical protein
MKPTKEQIDIVAFEIFNADFGGQMVQLDWQWLPERIKSHYRNRAVSAILAWEKIRSEK